MTEAPPERLAPAPGLLIRHWGGDAAVVYDGARAMTHLLDIGVAELLEGGPVGADALDAATRDELLRLGLLRRCR